MVIDDRCYPLNISFDVVMRMLEMFKDQSIPDVIKPMLALRMFTGKDLSEEISLEESVEIFLRIFDEQIKTSNRKHEITDLKGNVIPVNPTDENGSKRVYSLIHDAEYIYASFRQAYGIDLFEERGRLHWKKFNALLNGLPSNTKLMEVIRIRTWKPQKGDSSTYKEQMRELQREYALPEE